MEIASLLMIVAGALAGLALRNRLSLSVARAGVAIGGIALTVALAIFGLLLAGWAPFASLPAGMVAAALFFLALAALPFSVAMWWARADRK